MTATARAVIPALGMLLALAAAGCGPDPATARGTAESFLDAHYVHINLESALPYTSGVARHKVQEEIRLVGGQTIDDATRKPAVHYRLLEERPAGGEAISYVYRARVTVEDADPLDRRWLLTVRREDGSWRVTNYQEFEE